MTRTVKHISLHTVLRVKQIVDFETAAEITYSHGSARVF